MWDLSKATDPIYFDASKFTDEQREKIKVDFAGSIVPVEPEPIGDGNAVFIGEGSHDDFVEQEKEDKGLKGLFGL